MNSIRLIIVFGVLGFFSGCVTTEKILDGASAFERKRYAQAIQFFLSEYESVNQIPAKADIAFHLGESYNHIGFYGDASKWFFDAYEKEYGLISLLKYAESIKKVGNYTEALAAYQILLDQTKDYDRFQKEVNACKVAQDWVVSAADRPELIVEEVAAFNSPNSDILNTVVNENHLFISSDRGQSQGRQFYAWTGNKFFDLFEIVNNNIENSLEPNMNTDLHESDFTTVGPITVFTRCQDSEEEYDVFCKLLFMVKEDDVWSEPMTFPFDKIGVNFMHPYIDPQTLRLYFSSDIDKAARGYDIYYSEYIDSEWTDPIPVNESNINSESNEIYPTVYKDTLYFSSDRPGLGGMDIYKTYKVNNKYVNPQNLLPPINSSFDDFKYLPFESNYTDRSSTAYFNSNRSNGSGRDDIYMYYVTVPEREEEVVVSNNVFTKQLMVRVVTPNDDDGLMYPLADVSILNETRNESIKTAFNGEVALDQPESQMRFRFSKPGYFTYKETVNINDLPKPDTIGNVITYNYRKVMDAIVLEKEIVLKNIYYDYDRWNIRPDARPVLDSLATLLFNNPSINIALTSHTDCRGEDDYNNELSQKRAESAVNYLVSKGVNDQRLSAQGYGESQPVIRCICEDCTEDEHQANRRTAFKVVE
ncbi:OmpA family protein [Membranihabitans marinus]|uniref:OmpA family protein n=1 Tax=Membranihabitans marinus TaxID=1227546 RepID=UPI001F449247|nr:OmpA family protein [Membranihabitans marinus]